MARQFIGIMSVLLLLGFVGLLFYKSYDDMSEQNRLRQGRIYSNSSEDLGGSNTVNNNTVVGSTVKDNVSIESIESGDNLNKDNLNKDNLNKDNLNKDNLNKDNLGKVEGKVEGKVYEGKVELLYKKNSARGDYRIVIVMDDRQVLNILDERYYKDPVVIGDRIRYKYVVGKRPLTEYIRVKEEVVENGY